MTRCMYGLVCVALGGAIGSALRYGAGLAFARLIPSAEIGGTLFVNVVGSGLLGFIMAWFLTLDSPRTLLMLFLTTGLMGGFTTFSTFSRDAVQLLLEGSLLRAATYIAVSVVASLGAFSVCLVAGRRLFA